MAGPTEEDLGGGGATGASGASGSTGASGATGATGPIIIDVFSSLLRTRSKNNFDFESDDQNFRYTIDTFDIGSKRITAFNYSPEYFRRKKASSSGMFQVFGGNIPSDMADTNTFNYKNSSSTPPPPLVCNLNKGTAEKIRPIKVLNLSPNYLGQTLDDCETPKVNPEINKELGINQKPNTMYLGTYQPSCSTHPRASGYAHEDNYECLSNYRGLSVPNFRYGTCCDDLLLCVSSLRLVWKDNKDWSAALFPPPTFGIGLAAGFRCNSADAIGIPECNKTSGCHGGFVLMADLPVGGPDDSGKNSYRGCKTKVGATPQETITLSEAYLEVTFFGAGNMDCGCSGHYNDIKVVGYQECVRCVYEKRNSVGRLVGFPNNETKSCTKTSIAPTTFCECVYNREYDTGTLSNTQIWMTNFYMPSYQFQDWKKISLEGNMLKSIDCAGEQYMSCNDPR